MTEALLDHQREGNRDTMHNTVKVDVNYRAPIVNGEILGRAAYCYAGIVE